MLARSGRAEPVRVPRPVRRVGFGVSIILNAALIWIVTNLVEWDVVPFLTRDFEELVPITVASIVVSMAINAVWLAFDPRWFRTLGDAVNSAFAFVVLLRTFQVFPFEFASAPWTGFTRALLILMVVATGVATLVTVGKLLVLPTRSGDPVG